MRTDLCTGHASTRIDYEKSIILETIYAICPDGRVLESNEVERSGSFSQGRTWSLSGKSAQEVQGTIEYIGKYPTPSITL